MSKVSTEFKLSKVSKVSTEFKLSKVSKASEMEEEGEEEDEA